MPVSKKNSLPRCLLITHKTMSSRMQKIKMSEHDGKFEGKYRFIFLVFGIIFFFACHNYMQELIMSLPGFDIGIMLGYLEVLGVTICSGIERSVVNDTARKAPWSSYWMLCLFLLISSATSNIALAYINYPTKVVFRSCKLIPTMLISMLYLGKKITRKELLFGVMISVGMILFGYADFKVSPNFNLIGIMLVCISVAADSFLPNYQEKIFEHGSSRLEVTYYTNILCLASMTFFFSLNGELQKGFAYAFANPRALLYMGIYTFLAYVAIGFHMALVKEYGGITTVLVGNTRKALTVVMSFVMFPKPISLLYIFGGIFVFGGLCAVAYYKEIEKKQSKHSGGDDSKV